MEKNEKTGGNAGSVWQNACKKIALQDNVFVNNTVSFVLNRVFSFFLTEKKIERE